MFLKIRCPECRARLKISEDRVGTRVKCPACGFRFVGARPEDSSIGEVPSAPVGWESGDGLSTEALPSLSSAATPRVTALDATNVSILTTGLVGALMTVALYLLVILPLQATLVGRLFSRGWVSVAILLLTCWSIAIMVMKLSRLRVQKNALLYDLLPQDLGDRIRAENVGAFMEHIGSLPLRSERSFRVNRILRGLQHFRFRRSTQEVAGLLDSQAEFDAVAVEASYTMLRSFIWAVPILGFIGTVVGIGEAVGSFSASVEGAASIDEIKGALGGVTGGLGTAFDTTLIALVMSIILMIPMSWLHKQEEDLLSSTGGYSNEELLMRLDAGVSGEGAAGVNALESIPVAKLDETLKAVAAAAELTCSMLERLDATLSELKTALSEPPGGSAEEGRPEPQDRG